MEDKVALRVNSLHLKLEKRYSGDIEEGFVAGTAKVCGDGKKQQ